MPEIFPWHVSEVVELWRVELRSCDLILKGKLYAYFICVSSE